MTMWLLDVDEPRKPSAVLTVVGTQTNEDRGDAHGTLLEVYSSRKKL